MNLASISRKNVRKAVIVVLLCAAVLMMTAALQAVTPPPLVQLCQSAKIGGLGTYSCTGPTYFGVPGSTVYVLGTNFTGSTYVDLYLDTNEIAISFTYYTNFVLALKIPATTSLGQHWITAVANNDGASQAPIQVESNWPAFRYSGTHKSSNPYENILNQSTVGSIDIAWSYPTQGAVTSSPAELDTATAKYNGVFENVTPSFDTYFGSWDGNVYDVDAVAGTKKWIFSTLTPVATSPAVNNGIVYVGSADGSLYALNASSGTPMWNVGTMGSVFSSPAFADGIAYFGSNDFNVYAVNAEGGVIWTFLTTNNVGTSPAVSNGLVYAASDDSILYAINATTGKQVWSTNVPTACTSVERSIRPMYVGSGALSSAAVANGVVYIAANNSVYTYNAVDGAPLWSSQLSTNSCDVPSTPAVANGIVYIGSPDDNLYALNARTGAILWNYATGGGIDSSPAVADGVVYFGSGDTNAYALNATTGALLWNFPTGGPVESSPIVANGTLYVGSDDDNMYAFNITGGQDMRFKMPRPNPSSLHPDPTLRLSWSPSKPKLSD